MSLHLGVIGGGITGLTAAYRLQQAGHRVTVLESSPEPGGKIRGGTVAGIRVEEGPDAFLPRDEGPLELLRELGLERTRSPAIFGAYIWHRGAMHKLPPGSPFGIPRSPMAAREAGLLSPLGAFRAGLETLNRSPLSGPDVSIGRFVRSRFGNEVATNLVDPLLAGVRGGTADDISLAAAAPEIDSLARQNRSVIVALRASDPVTPRFIAPEDGLQRIPQELTARLDDVRTNARVTKLSAAKPELHVEVEGSSITFDGVLIACPPHAAADVVTDVAPEAASDMRRIGYASLVVITLVYPPGSFEAPGDGSGLLVPTGSGLTISACTWYSHKWPHVTSDGRQVVRCVIGRSGEDPNAERGDRDLAAAAHRDLQASVGVSAPFLSHRVTRWPRAIPQYAVGHLELVRGIEQRLRDAGPILVAGSGYRGTGIPDCIAQATAAAQALPELVEARRR